MWFGLKMNKKDFIVPFVFGLISLIGVLWFNDYLNTFFMTNDLSTELFTFSTLLFGLVLTAYSMLFGVIPSMKKGFKNSITMTNINFYFRACLFFLLVSIILSTGYLIYKNFLLFLINLVFLGIDIGFFSYTISLINEVYEFIIEENQ